MDKDTNLSNEQIKKLIEEFKSADPSSKTDPNDFAKKHLSPDQMEAFKKLLNNPALIKSILASDKAKAILKQLKGDKDES